MADPRNPKDAYIPADDVLLRGYCGPIRVFHPTAREWELTTYAWGRVIFGDRVVPADGLTMDMPWEEAQARDNAARVMAEGMRRPACKGSHCQPSPIAFDPDDPCDACDGSSYLLPSAPIEHLLDRPGSLLTAAQSAACVAWSYRSWRVGGPVLRGVIAPYYDAIDNGWGRVDCVGAGVSVGVYPRARENGQGWRVIFHGTDDTPDIEVSGPETGPDGRACADRAALAHNFALINADGSVTTPDLPTDRSPK